VTLPPLHYCIIEDPVIKDDAGELVYDKHGQVKINLGDSEIRTAMIFKQPFPLYFGEKLIKIEKLPVVNRDCAIKLEALRDFNDDNKKARVAGEEWLEYGPKIYIPRIEVKLVQHIEPYVISSN
jgi:major vault protein